MSFSDPLLLPVPADMDLIYKSSNLHFGIVKSVEDPQKRGRVLVECPSLFDEGAENWTSWAEFCSTPVGSQNKKGDMGLWWPPVPGLFVMLGFEGGNPKKPYAMPCSAWGQDGEPYVPAEVANAGGKGIHIRCLKSEAGHTLLMDDNGQGEAMFLCDWTGAGHFWHAPGKKADEKSSAECSASRMRKGAMRGTATAFAGNQGTPGDVTKDGAAIIGTIDLNGQGTVYVSRNDNGQVFLFACNKKTEVGPAIILDADENRIILDAGGVQLQIDGKRGGIYVTRQLIIEEIAIPFKEFIIGILGLVTDRFKAFCK